MKTLVLQDKTIITFSELKELKIPCVITEIRMFGIYNEMVESPDLPTAVSSSVDKYWKEKERYEKAQ